MRIYVNASMREAGGLICNLDHREADDLFADEEALLEDLGDHILAQTLLLDVHHGVVPRGSRAAYAVRSKALPDANCRWAVKRLDILHPASRGTPARTRHLAVLCAIVPRNHLSGRFHKRHTDTAPGTSLFLAPSQHFFGAQAASRQVLYN